MSHAPQRTGAPPRLFSRSRLENSSRKAEIVDSLVFMIAGLLLPAWLLGHLFLTFYPATGTSLLADTGDSKMAAVADASDTSELDLPKADLTNKGADQVGAEIGADASAGTERTNALQGKYDSLAAQFQSLKGKSSDFEKKLATLQNANSALQQENASLKSKAAKMSSSDTSADAFSSLEQQFNAVTAKLSASQQSLNDAETKLQLTQGQVKTLRVSLESTQSELAAAEQRASQLAAVSKPNAGSDVGEIPAEYSVDDGANEGAISKLEQQISKLNQQLESAGTALKTTAQTLAGREQELRQANDALHDLKTQNSELKTALNVAQQRPRQTEPPKQAPLAQEVYRDFVSSQGSVAKMAFIRWEGDQVVVRSFADKKLHRLDLNRFGEADQIYLLDQK